MKNKDLRRTAESIHRTRAASSIEKMSREELIEYAKRLEIDQIELEVQNTELQKSQREQDQLRFELEKATHRYEELYSFAPMPYITLDARGIILNANLRAQDILGVARKYLQGKPFVVFLNPEDHENFYGFVKKAFQLKKTVDTTFQVKKRNEQTFTALITAISTTSGHCHAILYDISVQTRLASELQEHQIGLNRMVEERTMQLAESNRKLRNEIRLHQETQHSLHTTNAQLTALFDNVDYYILFCNQNASPILFNSRYAAIMKEMLGIDMRQGLSPHTFLKTREEREFWVNCHLRVLSGEKFSEVFGYPPEKPVRFFETSFNPVRDDDGIIGFSEITREITGEKQQQDELRKREELLRTLSDNLPDGFIYRLRRDKEDVLHVDYIGAGIEDMTGITAQEMQKNPAMIYNLIHPEDRSKLLISREQAMKNNTPMDLRFRYFRPDGSIGWVRTRTAISREDEQIVQNGLLFDITGQVKTENALQESVDRQRSIFESLNQAIYVSDPASYRILYANAALQSLYDIELNGKVCHQALHNLEQPCPFCTNSIIQKLKGRAYEWESYHAVLDKYFQISNRMIPWDDGRMVRLEIATDITPKKRIEKELRRREEYYRLIAREYPDGFLALLDHSMRILFAEGTLLRQISDIPENLSNRSLDILFSPTLIAELATRYRKILEAGDSIQLYDETSAGHVRIEIVPLRKQPDSKARALLICTRER